MRKGEDRRTAGICAELDIGSNAILSLVPASRFGSSPISAVAVCRTISL